MKFRFKMSLHLLVLWYLFFISGLLGAQALSLPGASTIGHDIRPSASVTAIRRLSSWLPALAGTPADGTVYILDSGKPGGTLFVAGGTHANEIAGIMTAILLVERAQVKAGRLIVLPHANESASTWNENPVIDPAWIALDTPSGRRFFKYGSRLTHPVHQILPDPDIYIHPASEEKLPGMEFRNLNRAYPGRADSGLTQLLALGIMRLLVAEKVDVAFDLHEAGTNSRLADMIVAHPDNLEQAAIGALYMEEIGQPMKLEPSSESFRGLSHREWGDATQAEAYLVETPNPGQTGALRPYDTVNDPAWPLSRRVATHVWTILSVLRARVDLDPGLELRAPILVSGIPEFAELAAKPLGVWLH